jgi:hypothetical protein
MIKKKFILVRQEWTIIPLQKMMEQKERYLKRHKKDLRTNDPMRAGYLSYYLLWNKPTLQESIKDYKKKFNL